MDNNPYIKKKSEETKIGRFVVHMDELERNGKVGPYSYVSVKNGVHVMPVVGDRICLLKQYRYPIDEWTYEFPGGAVEDGYNPVDAAKRELQEESGYEADEIIPLGFVHPSYGYTDEKVYLFAAICSKKVKTQLEPLEVIESDLYSFEEVEKMIKEEKITLGNSLLCWMRYKEYLQNIEGNNR